MNPLLIVSLTGQSFFRIFLFACLYNNDGKMAWKKTEKISLQQETRTQSLRVPSGEIVQLHKSTLLQWWHDTTHFPIRIFFPVTLPNRTPRTSSAGCGNVYATLHALPERQRLHKELVVSLSRGSSQRSISPVFHSFGFSNAFGPQYKLWEKWLVINVRKVKW